jgi:hypothetical protein
MDTEQDVVTQHFDVPILEVEGVMGVYSCRIERGLVIRCICDREVGQGGDADGWDCGTRDTGVVPGSGVTACSGGGD